MREGVDGEEEKKASGKGLRRKGREREGMKGVGNDRNGEGMCVIMHGRGEQRETKS